MLVYQRLNSLKIECCGQGAVQCPTLLFSQALAYSFDLMIASRTLHVLGHAFVEGNSHPRLGHRPARTQTFDSSACRTPPQLNTTGRMAWPATAARTTCAPPRGKIFRAQAPKWGVGPVTLGLNSKSHCCTFFSISWFI